MSNTQAGNEAVIYAEYRLLNALVLDEEYRRDSRVHSDLFVHETAKSVFKALDHLDSEDVHITEASLFQASNEIDFNVNRGVIQTIFEVDTEAPATLVDILALLETSKKKKILAERFSELSSLANKAGPLDTDAASSLLFDVDKVLNTGYQWTLLKDFSVWSDEYIEELKDRAKGKMFSYGDPNLDRMIFKGAYPGAITTIAAGTGQGKSTFVINLISSLIDQYIPSMYVSLEMGGMDTYDRMIALRRQIPVKDLHVHDESLYSIIDIVEEEKKSLETNKKFYFIEEPSLSIAKLRGLIKEFKQRAKSDYAVIAIDLVTQLREFMHPQGGQSVANSMEQAMNDLNALAKEQNVHFITVVQFNRDADNYKIMCLEDLDMLRPGLNNIKNSHAIAERSRVVLSLFRKRYYIDRYLQHIPEAQDVPDLMEAVILKNSSGPVGEIFKYLFRGETFECMPLTEEEEAQYEVETTAKNMMAEMEDAIGMK